MRTLLNLFIFIALLGNLAKAGEICADAPVDPLAQLAAAGCRVESVANDCKEWFTQNPDTIRFAKSCDRAEPALDTRSLFVACGKQFGDQWTSELSAMSKAAENLDRCDREIECKKQLAFDAYFSCRGDDGKPQFPCADDKQLADVSAGDLLRKRENLRAQAARDPKLRAILDENHVKVLDEQNRSLSLSPIAVTTLLKSELQKIGVKTQCYNSLGVTTMMCSAAAEIIDPTLLLGGAAAGLKGGKWAARILSGIGTEKRIATAAIDGMEFTEAAAKSSSMSIAGQLNKQKKMLDGLGVTYGDLRTSRPEGALPVTSLRQRVQKSDVVPGIDDLLEIKSGAKKVKARSPATRALEHPDFNAELASLQKDGYQVAIDPTLSHPGETVSGIHMEGAKMIFLRPDLSWGGFMHEVQHQHFAKFIRHNYEDFALHVRSGHKLSESFPPEVRAKYSPQQIRELEKFLNADMPELATNERLSGMQEMGLYGFHGYIGGGPGHQYTDSFARSALEALSKQGPLSAPQQKLLAEIKARALGAKVAGPLTAVGATGALIGGVGTGLHYLYNANTREVFLRSRDDDSYLYVTPDDQIGTSNPHPHREYDDDN